MRPGSATGASAESDRLAFDDVVPWFHAHLGKVQVESEQSLAVVDDDAVPFEIEGLGQDYRPAVNR